MRLASQAQEATLAAFTASLADVGWLASTGDPDAAAIVAEGLVDAWDGWNAEMLAVWRPETNRLQEVAIAEIGEAGVDAVFEAVSNHVDSSLMSAMERYFDTRSTDKSNADRGLWPEWLDALKRDLCWAGVEAVLHRPGFFTALLCYYRAGRWPCAWEDGDRGKRVVLL